MRPDWRDVLLLIWALNSAAFIVIYFREAVG